MLTAASPLVNPARRSPAPAPGLLRRPLPAVLLALSLGLLPAAVAQASPGPLYEHSALGAGEEGGEWFGYSVATSSDGSTLIVGAPHAHGETGAAWVFTRSGTSWVRQAELELPAGPGGASGSARPALAPHAARAAAGGEEEDLQDHFGARVALSGDGSTAVVTAPGLEAGIGAAYVFTRSGSSWSVSAELTGGPGERGEGRFGRGLALTPDGSTAVVGAPRDAGGLGAAWLFTRQGSVWTRGAELTAPSPAGESHFGGSAAISSTADTVLVGAPGEGGYVGKAWVFARQHEAWSEQGELSGAPAASGESHFGRAVALSAAGDTALVGAPGDRSGAGGAFVFSRAAGAWSAQGPELTGGGELGEAGFGYSGALSADGSTALIGGPQDKSATGGGAAWEFSRTGAAWTQLGPKLSAKGGQFGYDVALDAEADIALIGAVRPNAGRGTAWVFTNEPPAEEPSGSGVPPGGGKKPSPKPAPSGGVLGFSGSAALALPLQSARPAAGGATSHVSLASRTIYVRGRGRAAIKLACSGGSTRCTGRVTLSTYRRAGRRIVKRAIGSATFSIAPGHATLTLTLTRLGRRYLAAKHGRLGGVLAIASPPSRAQSATVKLRTVKVTVRRKRPRR